MDPFALRARLSDADAQDTTSGLKTLLADPRRLTYNCAVPPKPVFQNEATRRSVIAAVMLVLLLASISLAYLTTIARRIEVDGLVVSIPRRWKNAKPPSSLRGVVGDIAVYYSDVIRSPSLIIASLKSGNLRSLDAAFALSMGALGIGPWERGSNASLRLGNLRTRLFTGGRVIRRRGQDFLRLNMLAVVTEDDRRYWMIYLSTDGSSADLLSDPTQHREFSTILRSIEIVD